MISTADEGIDNSLEMLSTDDWVTYQQRYLFIDRILKKSYGGLG